MTSQNSLLSFVNPRKVCVTDKPTNHPDLLPFENLPKLILLGRSNVGKSTLLNCLCQGQFVKSSKSPGSSQRFTFFIIKDRAVLVDAPGYGFSTAPVHKKQKWTRAWSCYLKEEDPNRIFILLIDGKVGPKAQDMASLSWLKETNTPFILVLTKWDRLSQKEKSRWKDTDQLDKANPLHIVKCSNKDKGSWKRLNNALWDAIYNKETFE